MIICIKWCRHEKVFRIHLSEICKLQTVYVTYNQHLCMCGPHFSIWIVNWKLTVLMLLRFLWSLLFVFQYLSSFCVPGTVLQTQIQFTYTITYRLTLTIQAESLPTLEGNQQSDIVTKKIYFKQRQPLWKCDSCFETWMIRSQSYTVEAGEEYYE